MGAHFMPGGILLLQLKEWKTYDELVDILEDKGIVIHDRAAVIKFLKRVNYYRLLGYCLPYGMKRSHAVSLPIETIQMTYEFDGRMRALITSALDIVENYLKSQIGHYHGEHYGPEGYMQSANYNRHHNDVRFKQHISKCIQENQRTRVVMHHNVVYGGHFPIWVIIEYFSMGMLSYFYSDLPNSDKRQLARNMYGVNYQMMESWTRCLTDLRNKCAHFNRLYYWSFAAMPGLPVSIGFVPDRRLFTQLVMLRLLYPDYDRWNRDMVDRLTTLINQYKGYINYDHIGFPANWDEILRY